MRNTALFGLEISVNGDKLEKKPTGIPRPNHGQVYLRKLLGKKAGARGWGCSLASLYDNLTQLKSLAR